MLKEDRVELLWVFRVIGRWLWLIIGCTLLGAASAFVIGSRMTPVYSTSATLLVERALTADALDYNALLTSERLASTYVHMLTGRPVLEAVIARLELEETPAALARRVKVALIPDTQLITLRVEYTDPTQAAWIANTIAEVFTAQIRAVQEQRYTGFLVQAQEQIVESSALIEDTQVKIDALGTPQTTQEQTELARLEAILAGYRSTYSTLLQNYEEMRLTTAQAAYNVVLVERAQVPENPIEHRKLYTVLAAVVGAMVAVGAAFLVEYLDDTIKTPDDASQALGLDSLAAISRLSKGEEELVVVADPYSPVAEAFRVLYTNIRFSSPDSPLRTILVTSPGVSEGKSITVANLAAAMAQAGLRVAVVDADLRHPRLHQLFGLDLHAEEGVGEQRGWGLSGSLLAGCTDGRLHSTQVEGLQVLPSGELPPNPAGLLGSQRMDELLDQLTHQVDVVLIDSPPVLPVADAALLAHSVDGVLLVLKASHTPRKAARQAAESLRQVGANLVGAVLNAVPTPRGRYYYGYYGYHQDGHAGRKRRDRRQKSPPAVAQQRSARKRKAA